MEANTTPNLIERFNQWLTESVMIKLFSIAILILILMIPASWIESLIRERQTRAADVIREVSDKWSGGQTLSGPVLVIPFTKVEILKRWENGKQTEEAIESKHQAYFLPENFIVTGKVKPQVLHRGIFDVAVYESEIAMEAKFLAPDFLLWNIPDERVHWNEAVLVNSISDLRGIDADPIVESGEKKFLAEPSSNIGIDISQIMSHQSKREAKPAEEVNVAISNGILIPLNWKTREDFSGQFAMKLSLKGSESLYFVPVGKSTQVDLSGPWSSPSFEGKLLPADRTVSESGFSSTWKVLSFNRPFSQQWIDQEQSLNGAEFGVRLLIPADQYQKSERTAKYHALIIILAFTALFLVEITSKTKIHPFQYILIGVALIVYYTLLLSLSEHLRYNMAYFIASVATILLVSLYSTTFLKSKQIMFLFTGLMTFFYIFIFIIIQAEDFSLLIGSVGLFLIISLLMYFSRNIKWYKESPVMQ
jgi:inner membrane protein